MPRKFITPEVKHQNRESQRRSRARRKELIDDLKRQLENFQRQGITASQEMQQAARAVQIENQRLRNLLQLRGVSQEEIHQHLSAPTPTSGSPTASAAAGLLQDQTKCSTCGNILLGPKLTLRTLSDRRLPDAGGSRQSTIEPALESVLSPASSSEYSHYSNTVERSSSRAPSERGRLTPAPALQVRIRDLDMNKSEVRKDQGEYTKILGEGRNRISISDLCNNASENYTGSSTTSDCFCPSDSALPISRTKTLETPCATAAAILVGVHGHADTEQARAALGCAGINDCSVRNTKIFQLMDRLS